MRYTFQNPAAAPMRRKIIRNAGDVPAARSIPQPMPAPTITAATNSLRMRIARLIAVAVARAEAPSCSVLATSEDVAASRCASSALDNLSRRALNPSSSRSRLSSRRRSCSGFCCCRFWSCRLPRSVTRRAPSLAVSAPSLSPPRKSTLRISVQPFRAESKERPKLNAAYCELTKLDTGQARRLLTRRTIRAAQASVKTKASTRKLLKYHGNITL